MLKDGPEICDLEQPEEEHCDELLGMYAPGPIAGSGRR
jgi:hypothetical protein